MIPEDIVQGAPKVDYKNLKIIFGLYAQVHFGTTNTTSVITIVSIEILKYN